jgi:protein-tyrosine-phosphatase
MKKILVVGSKNTYRSIIVAEVLKSAIAAKGKNGFEVQSAGIMAFPDIPAEPEAINQLKDINIEGDFRSRPLDKRSVADADMILTMSGKIRSAIIAKFPEKSGLTQVFGVFFGGEAFDLASGPGVAGEAAGIITKGFDRLDII